jgi:predicted RNA-binding protein Jag
MSDEEAIRKALAEIGRRGGRARAKVLTAKERTRIATKASRAAAKARTRKAEARRNLTPQEEGRASARRFLTELEPLMTPEIRRAVEAQTRKARGRKKTK